MELRRSCAPDKQTMVESSFEVTKDSFHGSPVQCRRVMHKLRQFIHRKRDVRSSERQVLERAHDLPILRGVRVGTAINQLECVTCREWRGNRLGIKHVGLGEEISNVFLLRKKQTSYGVMSLDTKEE